MRRLVTFFAVATATAVLILNWLNDGDIYAAVEPVVAEWDAELLARNAGLQPSALQEEPEAP